MLLLSDIKEIGVVDFISVVGFVYFKMARPAFWEATGEAGFCYYGG
jgi:hypothetical protein